MPRFCGLLQGPKGAEKEEQGQRLTHDLQTSVYLSPQGAVSQDLGCVSLTRAAIVGPVCR